MSQLLPARFMLIFRYDQYRLEVLDFSLDLLQVSDRNDRRLQVSQFLNEVVLEVLINVLMVLNESSLLVDSFLNRIQYL